LVNKQFDINRSTVIKSLSDQKAQQLFHAIVTNGKSDSMLLRELELTRKEYYGRISSLISVGLVKRKGKKYFVTAFGRVVYEVQLRLAKAVDNLYKFKAIESLNSGEVSQGERKKAIEQFLATNDIEDVIGEEKITSEQVLIRG